MDPQRGFRGRTRRIRAGLKAILRRPHAALAVISAAAGCAGIPESPRTAYAVPPAALEPREGAADDLPSFAIAASAPGVPQGSLPARVDDALAAGRLGLFPVERFELAAGDCGDCGVPAAALWWFRDEVIAVPKVSARASGPAEPAPPAIVWLGAPQRIVGARLSDDAREIRVGGRSIPFALTPPIATNAAYADASTARFFAGRSLTIRGTEVEGSTGSVFVARTIFPENERIDLTVLRSAPLRRNELLGTLLEAQTDARYRLLYARSEPTGWGGLPVVAFVLTGAQGDDDGSRAGHLAIATGVLGERGEWDEWLVTNFYPLLEGNAKGIIPASLPIDNYLYDLNSGQLYYRPGYMLVAVLARPRAAVAVQRALENTLHALHCGSIEFDRARRNSTAMTIDPLRELGWRIPTVGPTSRIVGIAAAPVATIVRWSFRTGGSAYATFAAERTRLLPRVAFEVAGHDLLHLAALDGDDEADLTEFERMLAEDVEGVLFVRLAQVPSARRFGTYPVPSLWAYGAGLLSDPGDYEGAPDAEDREFPDALRGTCGAPGS
ncbi:MAG TPA: hypothetical protein VF339_10235 [Gammaproteobacteria bacterium]